MKLITIIITALLLSTSVMATEIVTPPTTQSFDKVKKKMKLAKKKVKKAKPSSPKK